MENKHNGCRNLIKRCTMHHSKIEIAAGKLKDKDADDLIIKGQ